MHLLVITKPQDGHSIYVQKAMQALGHRVSIWCPGEYPRRQAHAIFLNQQGCRWSSDTECDFLAADVVWFRRPELPRAPDSLSVEDQENARREYGTFIKSCWALVAPQARWINPLYSLYYSNSKVYQLAEAVRVGLKIPSTLVSNHATEIRDFLQRENPVIFKSFCPLYWHEPESLRLFYTTVLDQLPGDEILRLSGGIFQQQIEKDYELRVTYFGDEYIAVKIDSQSHPQARVDWRAVPIQQLTIQSVALPGAIDQSCRALMKRLGILMGCFDFIVTPQGEYIFLEVNEQGQFLWIEQRNPEIKILEKFIRFVLILAKSGFCAKTLAYLALADFI